MMYIFALATATWMCLVHPTADKHLQTVLINLLDPIIWSEQKISKETTSSHFRVMSPASTFARLGTKGQGNYRGGTLHNNPQDMSSILNIFGMATIWKKNHVLYKENYSQIFSMMQATFHSQVAGNYRVS